MTDEDTSPEATGPMSKTYSIDVRVFLAAITTTMALAFGTGVAFGPSHSPIALSSPPNPHSKISKERVDILNERHVNIVRPSLEDLGAGSVQYDPYSRAQGTEEGAEERQYQPAGQHLLVDIAEVEAAFLNSEERLADAMVKSVEGAGLTMLSYHCHALQPAGVSCVGVLLESHISFHTWPEEGVITLDLFTCGAKPLLPVVPTLERLFGIPRIDKETGELGKAKTQWSHELRGFRGEGADSVYHLDSKSDLSFWIMSALQYHTKDEVVSKQTKHQRIDIWDYLDVDDTPSHLDAIRHNLTVGDPRWLTPEVATPDRYVFLNGAVMSMRDSEFELHESLVHPVMFTHPNPTNVAIVGGGHGGAMREVLKHDTVASATLVEVDEELLAVTREHLFYFTDCSAIQGSKPDCFDDERAHAVHRPANEYFEETAGEDGAEKFDVVILDMHDVRGKSPTENHYKDGALFDNILKSMSDDGVMVIKIGNAPTIHDPRASLGVASIREEMMVMLEEHPDTGALMVYEEAHCGFAVPMAFLIVCKDASCRKNWYAASDEKDTEIYTRLRNPVEEGTQLLVHYDGSTQESFQYTPIAWETIYCRRDPVPFECAYRGLDMEMDAYEYNAENPEEGSFKIETVQVDGLDVPKVTATEDIPKGSYIMPYDLASSFSAGQEVLDNLKANTEISGTGGVVVIEDFLEFINQHGHPTGHDGRELTYVEIGASFLIRKSEDKEEANIAKWVPKHPDGKNPTFSPVYERHMISFDLFLVASKDIKEGEELVKPVDLWAN